MADFDGIPTPTASNTGTLARIAKKLPEGTAGAFLLVAAEIPEFVSLYKKRDYDGMTREAAGFGAGVGASLLAGFIYGAAVGSETGPGAFFTGLGGMVIGGASYYLADHYTQEEVGAWQARMHDEKNIAFIDAISQNLPQDLDSPNPTLEKMMADNPAIKPVIEKMMELNRKLQTYHSFYEMHPNDSQAKADLIEQTLKYSDEIVALANLGEAGRSAVKAILTQGDSTTPEQIKSANDHYADVDARLPRARDLLSKIPTKAEFESDPKWAFLHDNAGFKTLVDKGRTDEAYQYLVQNAPDSVIDLIKDPAKLTAFNNSMRADMMDALLTKRLQGNATLGTLLGEMPTLEQLQKTPGLKDNLTFIKLAEMRDQQRATMETQAAAIKKKYQIGPNGQVYDSFGYTEALAELNLQRRQFNEQFKTALGTLNNNDLQTLKTLSVASPDVLSRFPQSISELNSNPAWQFLKDNSAINKVVTLLQEGKKDGAFTSLVKNVPENIIQEIQDPKKFAAANDQAKAAIIDTIAGQMLSNNLALDRLNIPEKFKPLIEMAKKINANNAQNADSMMNPGFAEDGGAGNALAYLLLGHLSSNDFKAELAKLGNADIVELLQAAKKGTDGTPQPQQKAEIDPPPPGDRNRARIDLALAEPPPAQATPDKQKPKIAAAAVPAIV